MATLLQNITDMATVLQNIADMATVLQNIADMVTVLQDIVNMATVSDVISHFKIFMVTLLSLLCTCESVFINRHRLFLKTLHTNFTPDVLCIKNFTVFYGTDIRVIALHQQCGALHKMWGIPLLFQVKVSRGTLLFGAR